MIFEKIHAGIMGVNCYITGDKDEVFVIDPGGSADEICSDLKKHGLNAKYIILTQKASSFRWEPKFLLRRRAALNSVTW